MFSHAIFFDATNDSYATVGKLKILHPSLLLLVVLTPNLCCFPIFVVKRGPDHYFKTQHEDVDAAHVKQMFYQIASKTKTDVQSAPPEDATARVNKVKTLKFFLC
jgi:hypothetical protein